MNFKPNLNLFKRVRQFRAYFQPKFHRVNDPKDLILLKQKISLSQLPKNFLLPFESEVHFDLHVNATAQAQVFKTILKNLLVQTAFQLLKNLKDLCLSIIALR